MGKQLFRSTVIFPRCPPQPALRSSHDIAQSLAIEWYLSNASVRREPKRCDPEASHGSKYGSFVLDVLLVSSLIVPIADGLFSARICETPLK